MDAQSLGFLTTLLIFTTFLSSILLVKILIYKLLIIIYTLAIDAVYCEFDDSNSHFTLQR